jgi:putative ABC transport system permease protein
MLRHYLTVALRNLLSHALFSAINLLGLALGLAAFVFLYQYVQFERSYDGFHEKADRIYRLRNDHFVDGRLVSSRATTYRDAGPSLQQDFPEVKTFVRLSGTFGNKVVIAGRRNDGRRTEGFEEKLFYADASFFDLFSFPLRKGNPATVLTAPFSAVLTERAAMRYFGTSDPTGSTLMVDGKGPFTVTGILRDLPPNSHLQFDFLFSINSLDDFRGRYAAKWSGAGGDVAYTYIGLQPNTDPLAFQARLPAFLRKYGSTYASSKEPSDALILQPVRDIHLNSQLELEAGPNGDGTVIYFLLLIAGGVILIAWMNYVNLTTARAAQRAREAGIRKALGSTRGGLLRQFLFESLLMNVLAALAALLLLWISVPFAGQFLRINTFFFSFREPACWATLLLTAGAGTLAAGFYPALVMASFRPAAVLKGNGTGAGKGFGLRQGLVVLQFVVSVAFLCAALAVFRQLEYMQSQPLGMNTAGTLVIQAPGVVDSSYFSRLKVLKRGLLNLGGVVSCTASSEIPGKAFSATRVVARWGQPVDQAQRFATAWVDEDFFPSYQIPVTHGRNFREGAGTDDRAVILNESMVKAVGISSSREAVGQRVMVQGAGECTIIGVAADYHHQSLAHPVRPAAFLLNTQRNRRFYSLKLSPKITGPRLNQLVHRVEGQWQGLFPANPFEYFFLEGWFGNQYRQEEQLKRVLTLFAGLAVLVACMGLSGLTHFTTRRRTREIGIRKVLGAPLLRILLLLCSDVMRLFVFGVLLAWLLAYTGIRHWLASFAFRMPVSASLFLVPALVVLLITLLVISFQTIRAALADPVKSLRQD